MLWRFARLAHVLYIGPSVILCPLQRAGQRDCHQQHGAVPPGRLPGSQLRPGRGHGVRRDAAIPALPDAKVHRRRPPEPPVAMK
jgi:hypothetical protein